MGHWGGAVGGTSFCTLFLVYGGAPVAVNKLQYGKDQDWNLNPRDLANLSKALWTAYERPINWQIVSIDAPASEIEAPILFLSGSKKRRVHREGNAQAARVHRARRHHPGRAERPQQGLHRQHGTTAQGHVSAEGLPQRPARAARGRPSDLHRHQARLEETAEPARGEQRLADLLPALRRIHVRRLAGQPRGERRLPAGDEPAVLRHGPGRTGRQVHVDPALHAAGQGAQGRSDRGPRCIMAAPKRNPQDWEAAARVLATTGAAGQASDGPDAQGSEAGRPRQGFAGRSPLAAPDGPHRP